MVRGTSRSRTVGEWNGGGRNDEVNSDGIGVENENENAS